MKFNNQDSTVLKIALVPAFILAMVVGALSMIALTVSTAVAGDMGKKAAQMDIVDTAVSAGSFNTLVTAIKAAELVDTLKGEGPYTVFAPTDEAFAKIPKDKLDSLLADKDALTKVLTYHVVSGKVMAADVVKLESAKTVEGQDVKIDASNGVKINDATVIKTDIETSNGVIHVIDTVLMPSS